MAALVVFMAAVFLTLSEGYVEHLFQQYAWAARQGQIRQWVQLLAYYYEENGSSWNGVDRFIAAMINQQGPGRKGLGPLRFVLLDSENRVVAAFGVGPGLPADGEEWRVPVVSGGRTVGTLRVYDRSVEGLNRIEDTVLRSMRVATVAGVAATAGVALLTGAWLSRRITRPLQQLIEATRRIRDGDLRPRLPTDARDEFGQVARAFNDMAAQLEKVEEMRRHLMADVAHELRTPLTIIQGQLELIQQGVKPAGPETLLPIQDEVMRLTRLVGDLHQLSLAEAGRLPLEKRPTDLVPLLNRLVDNFRVEAEAKGVELALTAPETAVSFVDPHRITQVFVNLIGNALRYSPAGGKVDVSVAEVPGEVKVVVSDTGPGIAPEHLPHIFDRFFRTDEARSRDAGGTGLGLAIAKEFVEAHGGRIEAASTPGKGASFTVTLPAVSSG